jgi:hypothetical protein
LKTLTRNSTALKASMALAIAGLQNNHAVV